MIFKNFWRSLSCKEEEPFAKLTNSWKQKNYSVLIITKFQFLEPNRAQNCEIEENQF